MKREENVQLKVGCETGPRKEGRGESRNESEDFGEEASSGDDEPYAGYVQLYSEKKIRGKLVQLIFAPIGQY